MPFSQGTSTMIPHRPQTTDGTTASRSITYTIGLDHRRGTTSVSSSETPMLIGTEMMSAITEQITVPYRNAIAPKWFVVGSQSMEKMPLSPAELNQAVDCCAVVTAMRTRMTSTSMPAASVRIWNPRSPSGLRCASALADPAGVAGSALVTALMRVRWSELHESCDLPYGVIWLSWQR